MYTVSSEFSHHSWSVLNDKLNDTLKKEAEGHTKNGKPEVTGREVHVDRLNREEEELEENISQHTPPAWSMTQAR